MKITWLNDEMTEAVITRGWWRKKQASVVRSKDSKDEFRHDYEWKRHWFFVETGYLIGKGYSIKLEKARQRRTAEAEWKSRHGKEWVPVVGLPRARLLK